MSKDLDIRKTVGKNLKKRKNLEHLEKIGKFMWLKYHAL